MLEHSWHYPSPNDFASLIRSTLPQGEGGFFRFHNTVSASYTIYAA